LDYVLINLTNGMEAKIDPEDLEIVSKHTWHRDGAGYARANIWQGNRKIAAPRLHRFVLGNDFDKSLHVDHINGDKLDNRKSNLRIVTSSQNAMNRGPQANNTSGYKGVTWVKQKNKWRAEIKAGKTKKHLGYFLCKHEAAKAYNTASLKYHGEHGYLNIIDESEAV
jgi:hypothetical protein